MNDERVEWKCPKCRDEVSAPDNGFGRAVVRAFQEQHADHTDRKGTR